MKVSFFKVWLFCTLFLFSQKNVVLLHGVLYFVETSRFISCLWYLNVWVELSAVSLHVVALWKRILKRAFSAYRQLLKATYSERNWPPFKRLAKNKYYVGRNKQHNRPWWNRYSTLKKRTPHKEKEISKLCFFFSSSPPNSFFLSNNNSFVDSF